MRSIRLQSGWLAGWPGRVSYGSYADFNLLKFPDKDQAMEKILDLTCLSDILTTAFRGCVSAQESAGSSVYIAGAGPIGRAAADCSRLLGAARIIVGDMNKERLALEKSTGYETVDLNGTSSLMMANSISKTAVAIMRTAGAPMRRLLSFERV